MGREAELEQVRAQVSDLEQKLQRVRDETTVLQRERPASLPPAKHKIHKTIALVVALVMWTFCGGAWIRSCNGCANLDNEKRAYEQMNKVSGWVRSEGPAFGNWTMAPRSCATGERLHFRGITLDAAWRRGPQRRGQRWLRVIEDQVRGTVLKLKAPLRDPVVLEEKRCVINTSWKRSDAPLGQGAIAFDCKLDGGRVTGNVRFFACGESTTPDAEYDRRKMGVW